MVWLKIMIVVCELIMIVCGIWSYLTADKTAEKRKGTIYEMPASQDKRISVCIIDIASALFFITTGIILYNADLPESLSIKIGMVGFILLVVMIVVLCVLLSLKKSFSFEFNAFSISLVVLGFALALCLMFSSIKKPVYGYESQSESSDYNDYNGNGKYDVSDYIKDEAPDLYNDIKDRYDSLTD